MSPQIFFGEQRPENNLMKTLNVLVDNSKN